MKRSTDDWNQRICHFDIRQQTAMINTMQEEITQNIYLVSKVTINHFKFKKNLEINKKFSAKSAELMMNYNNLTVTT